MMNSYTLEVYAKQHKPCFVVTIKHIMLAGVYFFNTLQEANNYIKEAKNTLKMYAPLNYNADGITANDDYMNIIKTVLHDDNICIDENGRTYSKIP